MNWIGIRHFGTLTLLLLALSIAGCGGKTDESNEADSSTSTNEQQSAGSSTGSSSSGSSSKPSPAQPVNSNGGSGKAILAFEISPASLMASQYAEPLEFEEMMANNPAMRPDQAEMLQGLSKVTGYVGTPKDMMSLMMLAQVGPSASMTEFPIDFLLDVEFKTAEAAAEVMADIKSNSEPVQIGGTELLKSNDPAAGPLYARINSPTSFSFGTQDFLTSSGTLPTSELKAAWGKLDSEAPLKLTLDLASGRPFFDEVSEMLRQQVPVLFVQWVKLIDHTKTLSFAVHPDSDKMLDLNLIGNNAEDTERINKLVGVMTQFAVATMQQELQQLPDSEAASKEVFESLLAMMKPVKEGDKVSVTLTKPEGFDTMVTERIAAARKAAQRAQEMNAYRQLALAAMNYESTYKRFPFAHKKGVSWRVLVLPYIEEVALYDQLEFDEEGNSPNIDIVADKMPAVFGEGGSLSNVAFIEVDKQPSTFAHVTDGTSNTIMLIQTKTPKPWTEPGGMTIDEAMEMVANLPEDEELICVFYDGSVRTLKSDTFSSDELRKRLDPRDGEPLTR